MASLKQDMTLPFKLLVFLSGLYSITQSNHMNSNSTNSTIKPLNVLFVSVPLPGHANPLLALGEELVRRGHNVTFCSLDSTANLKDKVMERDISYLSAGSVTNEEHLLKKLAVSFPYNNPWKLYQSVMAFNEWRNFNSKVIVEYVFASNLTRWDVVIIDHFLSNSVPCIAKHQNVSVISLVNKPLRDQGPSWSYPLPLCGKTDDLSFLDRLINVPFLLVAASLMESTLLYKSPITDQLCNKIFHWGPLEGWEYPVIVRTVIGFEYPRTISPLTEYVGPLLSKLNKPLPTDLSKWIQDKEDNSVVYISMGSFLNTTTDIAIAFANSTNNTRYSVIWSLKKFHHHVVSDMELDPNKYFISSWTPQATLLQHKSISMAILHGGSNGVHEALYYGVPLIIIPQCCDQLDWAIRVEHSGVGVQLKPHQVTSQTIKKSIQTIESGGYREKAQKMSQIMKRAGGVDKAADLVEFYVNVGYDHLIPGPVKYKWSWIQYYNIDVHVTLLCIILIIMYCIVKVCKYCCRYCCLKKQKKD